MTTNQEDSAEELEQKKTAFCAKKKKVKQKRNGLKIETEQYKFAVSENSLG